MWAILAVPVESSFKGSLKGVHRIWALRVPLGGVSFKGSCQGSLGLGF